jgi:Na+/H+ antiporter NhaD/arsenite permease-like protein
VGPLPPTWSVAPFAALLLAIAVLPVAAPRLWAPNRNKALLGALLGLPVAAWVGAREPAALGHALHEYLAFVSLLGALYVIAGGVVVRGTLAGTPGRNAALLASGAVAASLIGTTGASVLLIRPLLRANSARRRVTHLVVFFIFVVSNAGGLLTPLGDPPLYLGFLRGVPFLWTLRLFPQWLFVNGALLLLCYAVDSSLYRKEGLAGPGHLGAAAAGPEVPVHLVGGRNLLYLAGVVGVLLAAGTLDLPPGAQEAGLLALAALSWLTTPRAHHLENGFEWHPIVEVAVVFAGLFATMTPALQLLNARGAGLGLASPAQYFWVSGLLSSILDNAPTYLAFASVASGVMGTDAGALGQLLATERGAAMLRAISLGAVLMGANSYVGNGPNFMVRAIAERGGVRMPGFFGYLAWSGAVLLPLWAAVTWLFLR